MPTATSPAPAIASVTGIFVPRQTRTVGFSSDAGGNPVLAGLFFDTAAESSYLTSFPGLLAGRQSVRLASELWAVEANLAYMPDSAGPVRTTWYLGYRNLQLNEG